MRSTSVSAAMLSPPSLNTALAPLGEWGEEHLERIEAIP